MADETDGTTSVWRSQAPLAPRPALGGDLTADVVVVGAGIAGLTIALLLAREGRGVVVLDDGAPGGGETSRTTAHLSNALDDRYFAIERMHGEQGARLAAESHTAAIETIERIVREETIACAFERVPGHLFLGPDNDTDFLRRELEAAHRAGLTGVELLSALDIGSFRAGPALRFPQQGQFHPLHYLSGLAAAISRLGGQIFTGAHVKDIRGGTPAILHTSQGHTVRAAAVAVATNSPITSTFSIHTKQASYRTYAVGARIRKGVIPHGLYWDTLDAYHYIRLTADEESGDHEILIVGGEDHKTGQQHPPEARHEALEQWARLRWPEIESVPWRWSGQVIETNDGLAFIGRSPLTSGEVFVATGDSGMGMTHGTIAGVLITDLIQKRENPWTELYSPSRKSLRARSLGDWLKENVNVAVQYKDWVTAGETDAKSSPLAPGEAAILRRGVSRIAAYRDESGQLHERSAVCTHLGCIVHWNAVEKTWDCPCHGSRFEVDGIVLNGPATRELGPAE